MVADAVGFPNPVPTLAVLLAQITALDTAQRVVATGQRGAPTGTRNTARDALWSSLHSLKAYVQTLADASPENSFTIVKSSGFKLATKGSHTKPPLDARLTGLSGVVGLVANARALTGGAKKHAAFNWQYSVDGGHTWVALPGTPTASTTVSGLPVMTNVSFRVSVTMAKVVQPWSQVVTIPVH
jgi:hypothetical protein